MFSRRNIAGLALAMLAIVAVGCGSSSSSKGDTRDTMVSGRTLAVPTGYKTIQKAVDAAKPGDLILVSPGIYHEAVNVTTDRLVIRGLDRNKTILEGDFTATNGIRVLGAKGVAIENMTARDYKSNGFFWTGVTGYRGSYLTAYRNGDYGVYAFDSTEGLIEDSYASGSPDAGFYVGGCQPCNTVVRNVVSEYNGLGYSGTNSGGDLLIINSVFRNNRAGIVPNTGSYEPCYPQSDNVIAGNLVYDNNYDGGPAIANAQLAQENGILVAGGWNNKILRNRVMNHKLTGIGLVPFPESNPSDIPSDTPAKTCAEQKKQTKPKTVPDLALWNAKHNVVQGNVVTGSGLADLATADGDDTNGNCFADNEAKVTAPANLEKLEPCKGAGTGDFTVGALNLLVLVDRPTSPSGDYKTQPIPPEQPGMTNPSTAPVKPAIGIVPKIDIDAIKVPDAPTQ